MGDRNRRVAIALAAFTAAAALPVGALSQRTTTAPSNKVTVVVLIDDAGMKLTAYVQLGSGGGKNEPTNIQTLLGPVPRGDYLSFTIFNRGKKVHNFTIFGKKTRSIRPGRKAHLFAQALVRGTFPYRSTLDKGKRFRGSFTIL